MENEKSMVSTAENVEKETSETEKVELEKKESEKTYTRDEVNKMLNAERAKERESVLKEVEAKKAEAKKLAEMDEIQKKDYEIERLNKEIAKRDADTAANNLMTEAIKQASEKGIPLEVMTALDYKNETAESIASKIEVYSKAFQKVKTSAIEDYSKEPAPQTGDKFEAPKSGYEKFLEKNYKK